MKFAPICLFVYKRPDHLSRVIDFLLKNKESSQTDLYIFSDGSKGESDKEGVQSVRNFIKTISGFASVKIKLNVTNLGLARSIVSGVTEVINERGRVIVLEDDIVVGKYFLHYMNTALEKYSDKEEVAGIHGYNLPISKKDLPESFFLKGADCWGWGTWKRSWDLLELDGQKLLDRLDKKALAYNFDLDGSHPYTQMLKDQVAGKNDSWAIRWHASMFLENKFTLHPTESLVQNIGLDYSGTHGGKSDLLSPGYSDKKISFFPDKIEENGTIRNLIIGFFKNPNQSAPNVKKSFFPFSIRSKIRTVKQRLYEILFSARNAKFNVLKEWYKGDYSSWADAQADCNGYTAPNILERVKTSLLKVKGGDAVYERDSVLFEEVEYSLPLLICLLYVNSVSKNRLNLVDFGGSLGSTYFQNRKYLDYVSELRWSIVEQKHFVDCGKEFFEDNELKFFDTIAECKNKNNPNLILLSSVLPYLENPYLILDEILASNFDYVLFDRTPFLFDGQSDKLLIQIVPPEIYEAEIPIWFLNYEKFLSFMNKKYVLHSSFDSMEEDFPLHLNIKNKCLLFKKEEYASK
ncbi:TIGR04325 family methyltransferase [Leptospira ilyithenensis]|uniref:TIGR04325 family methyltransferase n=1 Tax=Leptospira ilyithenensis TaxID=2484901 RepID=UPI001438476D|nr:TIGR04325 family methyltransferase [Leptospira ilyithenensis]